MVEDFWLLTCIPARRNTLCAEKQRRYFQFRRGTLITHKFNSHFKYAKHSVIISQPVTTSPVEKYLKVWIGASIPWLDGSTQSAPVVHLSCPISCSWHI
jgi:hypothetical protein